MLAALLLAVAAPEGGSGQLTAGVSDQPGAALTLFAEHFYRGKSVRYTVDEGDIRPGFAPASVKAVGRWLVCSEPRFKGRCVEVDKDFPVEAALGINFNIRSLRALQPGSGAALPPPGAKPGGPSLAGSSSQFFAEPRYGSERALACPDGAPGLACAKRTAEDLCRRAGYRAAAHFTLQRERGLYYLADVLCIKP